MVEIDKNIKKEAWLKTLKKEGIEEKVDREIEKETTENREERERERIEEEGIKGIIRILKKKKAKGKDSLYSRMKHGNMERKC